MPKLLLKFNAAVIKEIPIEKSALVVGRKADSDIVIDNPAISGHHCKIVLSGDTYFVEDLESTNGTFLNEKRVMKAGLHNNDVIGLAKHALVFVEDAAPPPAAAAKKDEPVIEGTMMLSPEQMDSMAKAGMANAPAETGKVGYLRILKGIVGEPEYELKGMSTYIGKSDRVQIRIKGKGLFGSAPEVVASVHRKPEGYVLVAVEEGYPVVNGSSVTGQVPLTEGAIIECGGTTMQFFTK
ncbi:MAG: FHA domain-containing protein [Elusimicrobiota bacterium]